MACSAALGSDFKPMARDSGMSFASLHLLGALHRYVASPRADEQALKRVVFPTGRLALVMMWFIELNEHASETYAGDP